MRQALTGERCWAVPQLKSDESGSKVNVRGNAANSEGEMLGPAPAET